MDHTNSSDLAVKHKGKPFIYAYHYGWLYFGVVAVEQAALTNFLSPE